MIEILRMKRAEGRPREDGVAVIGVFQARVGELILEGCHILRLTDDSVAVILPTFARKNCGLKRSARFADRERYLDFRRLALEAYHALPMQTVVDEAVADSLQMAGIA